MQLLYFSQTQNYFLSPFNGTNTFWHIFFLFSKKKDFWKWKNTPWNTKQNTLVCVWLKFSTNQGRIFCGISAKCSLTNLLSGSRSDDLLGRTFFPKVTSHIINRIQVRALRRPVVYNHLLEMVLHQQREDCSAGRWRFHSDSVWLLTGYSFLINTRRISLYSRFFARFPAAPTSVFHCEDGVLQVSRLTGQRAPAWSHQTRRHAFSMNNPCPCTKHAEVSFQKALN